MIFNFSLPVFSTPVDITTRRLAVGNLNQSVTENDIRSCFEACGRIDKVKLHVDSNTGRSKGFAFVFFRSSNDAKFAVGKLHMFVLKGRSVSLS